MPSAPIINDTVIIGELMPQTSQESRANRIIRSDVDRPLCMVDIVDATGAVIGAGIGVTDAIALHNAAFLSQAGNLCTGLPVEGMMSRQFAVVDVDPGDPFGGPQVPAARFRATIIELLVTEHTLANPDQYLTPHPKFSPHHDRTGSVSEENPNTGEAIMLTLDVRRRGLLNQLARMVGLEELTFEGSKK